MSARILTWLVLVLLSLATPAQQTARERWEAMTPAEQSVLRKRFEKLQAMQEGRQRELRQRHGRWQESERRTLERLPRATREELDALAPPKRREVLRELVEEDLAARGRDLRDHLPPEWRERLETARPEDRRGIVDEFRRQQRTRWLPGVLDHAQRELGLQASERGAIEALPPAEREQQLLELHARSLRRRMDRDGLPPWIPADEWPRLSGLEPRPFLEEVHALRREAGDRGQQRMRPAPGSDQPGPSRGQGRSGPPGPPGPPERGRRAEQAQPGLPRDLARPDPTWRVELSKLTPEERRSAIEARVRVRVDEFLERHPETLTTEQRTALDAAHGREYFELLRTTAGSGGPASRGTRSPRGGRGGGRPQGSGDRRHPDGARGERPPTRPPRR